MEDKKWISSQNRFENAVIPSITDHLPVGIYELNYDSFKESFYLQKIADKFTLPEKIYGIEKDFISRCITTFSHLKSNFGILMKGLQGTGKTVTAKQLCIELDLPVIVINKAYRDMDNFINCINQNIILFFDEFEKIYGLRDYDMDEERPNISSLLTLMDGVFTSEYKRLFLMTTNEVYLPNPLVSRPSRIRYIKEFTDLNYESIIEILNDCVSNKKDIDKLAKILAGLKFITVDIVKAIAEEYNIFNTCEPEFFEIFNTSEPEETVVVYTLDENNEKIILADNFSSKPLFYHEGYCFSVKLNRYRIAESYVEGADYIEVLDLNNNDKKIKLYFKPTTAIHSSMVDYVF